MVRRIFYTLVIIFASMSAAHAQGGVFNDIALGSDGKPAAGATVLVGPLTATGCPLACTVPLSPTVTVYTDRTLVTPKTVTSDAQGNFNFAVRSGFYMVQVTKGSSTYSYTVNVAPDGGRVYNIRDSDYFAVGSTTGGIAEAYADCPSTGCEVLVSNNVTVSTPSTITIAAGKPLVLNLSSHKITAANSSGIGLTFTAADINSRTKLVIENGALACSWSNSSLTGFKFSAMTDVYLQEVDLSSCDHSGIGMLWDDVEDAHWTGGSARFNSLAFQAQNATNQNSVDNVHFDSNVNAVLLKDVGGITFSHCLVQSNTGQHAFSATTTAGNNATELRVRDCHFENNGDGTAASRQIYIAPFAAQSYLNIQLTGNIFSQGAFAPGSSPIEVAGSQNVQPVHMEMNQFNGYGTTAVVIGETQYRHVNLGDNGGTEACDVCLAVPNVNGDAGVAFRPTGATNKYQIFAGHPADFQGFLQFWNETANASILSYNGTTWTFPSAILATSTFTANGNSAFTALVDFTGASINAGLPVTAADAGTLLSSKNTSAANASQFTLKHNGIAVEMDSLRGGFILTPSSGTTTITQGGIAVTGNSSVTGNFLATRNAGGFQNMAFNATPTFDLNTGNVFQMTLTANVTSTAISNGINGQLVTFIICQNGAGAWTWAWGAAFNGADAIGATASKCNVQQFVMDSTGTTLKAVSAMKTNE